MPMPNGLNHWEISRRFIIQADAELAAGDLPAASALVWDAAACAMRSIAESRGWKRESEHDLIDAAFELAREAGRRDIAKLFRVAHTAPWLVDEGWIDKASVAMDIEATEKLLKILDSLDIA